jgi:hypothetical protein
MTSPSFSVLRGDPDDDELAALTVVLLLLTPAARTVRHESLRRPGWNRENYLPPGAWSGGRIG